MYDFVDMFRDSLKFWDMKMYHPKIVALQKDLEHVRDSADSIPTTSILLDLPIPVQTDSTSIIRRGIKRDDGTHVILVELMGLQKKYAIKESDSLIEFKWSKWHFQTQLEVISSSAKWFSFCF